MQKVNDPKEFSDWKLDQILNEHKVTTKKHIALSRKISHRCKGITQALCFSMDSLGTRINGHDYHLSGCLGRGFGNSPMWNFYGAKHKGVCLGFYKESLLSTLAKQVGEKGLHHGEIHYDNEPLPYEWNNPYQLDLDRVLEIGVENYCYEFLERSAAHIYLKKQLAWSYEDEYRTLIINNNINRFKFNYGDTLSNISFGVKCSQRNKDTIRRIAEPRGISCHDLYVKNHTLQMDLSN